MTPLVPNLAPLSEQNEQALPSPMATPGDEDADLGRLGSRSPFSAMGAATPFSTGGFTPGSQMSSPATPHDAAGQFRSPSYTPASESPTGTSPADEFSPSYVSMASPAYTPDGTSSPSYHSFVDRGTSQYKMDYSPTSYEPGTSPMSDHYTSPVTSPAARSAYRAFEPTSPVDTPVHEMMTSEAGAMSPMGVGEPMSPVVNAFSSAPYETDRVAPTSPSYTPHEAPVAGGADESEQFEGGADLVNAEEDSDDDAMDAVFDHEDEGEEGGY